MAISDNFDVLMMFLDVSIKFNCQKRKTCICVTLKNIGGIMFTQMGKFLEFEEEKRCIHIVQL